VSDCLVLNGNYQPLSLLPLSVVGWQQAVKLYFLDRVRIIETYDNWEVHSPNMDFKVPALVALRKYYPVKKQIRFTRYNLFLRDMYQCQYCTDTFPTTELTIDHVLPLSKGGKTNWQNCVSACKKCNTKKGNTVGQMIPIRKAFTPDYFNLSSIRRTRPFTVRHSSWLEYIGNVDDFKFSKDSHQ
jgi:5-methylcytosine-specific restriction endonuclease McrA|tara:strand:+ start:318 stop:872 length:555 start_codon:yes stop_codon:yes gene_type:complete